jgi:tight adherence protein B
MTTAILLFFCVFALTAIVLLMVTSRGAQDAKQARERLEALGAPQAPAEVDDLNMVRRAEALSTVPWLDRFLSRLDLSPRLRLLLYQAGIKWTVGRLVLVAALIAVVAGELVNWRTGAVLASLVASGAGGAAPFLFVFWKRDQRFNRIRQLLPDALDMMASAIRAGHSFSSAMGMVSRESVEPVKSEIRQCFEEQNFGLDLRVAMANLAYRVPVRDVRVIVTAVLIQKETGGNLTEILDKVAYLIREDFRLQRQISVHTAQGRMTGWVLSILPIVLGFLLYLVSPEHMSLLWRRPFGWKLIYTALVMETIGALLIRKIVRIDI